jgi:hypothetical protein
MNDFSFWQKAVSLALLLVVSLYIFSADASRDIADYIWSTALSLDSPSQALTQTTAAPSVWDGISNVSDNASADQAGSASAASTAESDSMDDDEAQDAEPGQDQNDKTE